MAEGSLRLMNGLQVLANKIDELGTRVDFARRIEISEQHLSMILSGRRGFSVAVGLKISKLTGLSVEQFAPVATPVKEPRRTAKRVARQ
jgi:plasmid maintenance system antidote protein VapI